MRSAVGFALGLSLGPPGAANAQQADPSRLLREPLFEISGTPVTLATLIIAAGILLVSLILAQFIRRALERFIVQRREDALGRGNLRVTIRLVQYSIVVGGLLMALSTVGIRLTALFAAGALFAVALGFAMQNVTANFISGVILLIERSIKPGDIIEVEGRFVQIREMGIRAAIARTLDEEDLIIPSSHLVQSIVRNFTLRDPLARLRAVVGVTYGSDMALVRRTLEEAAAGLKWRSHAKPPVVYMKAFGSSSVDFEVSVWFEDPWSRQRRGSDLHEAIWWALKEAGVTIAFPQLDVHFDAEAIEAARKGRAGGTTAGPKPA